MLWQTIAKKCVFGEGGISKLREVISWRWWGNPSCIERIAASAAPPGRERTVVQNKPAAAVMRGKIHDLFCTFTAESKSTVLSKFDQGDLCLYFFFYLLYYCIAMFFNKIRTYLVHACRGLSIIIYL